MSESSISLSDLANTLRAAKTPEQQLTLNPATLGAATYASHLFASMGVSALTLAEANIADTETAITVTGKASILSLPDLQVTITVTTQEGAFAFSLQATPSSTTPLQVAGFSFVALAQVAVTVNVQLTAGKPSFSGSVTGTMQLGGVEVPISISLPVTPQGMRVSGSFGETAGPGISALASMMQGVDLVQSLPDGLSNLLTLQSFDLLLGPKPYLSFTLGSAQSLSLIPQKLSLDSATLSLGVLLPTAHSALHVDFNLRAVLRAGNNTFPIELVKDESGEWEITLEEFAVPLPGLSDLVQLFGSANELESMMSGLGSFGALSLTRLQVRVDLAQRLISSLSFSAAAQSEWTLPLFGDVSFGKPTLSLSVEGLRLGTGGAAPTLLFRVASERSWELIAGSLSLQGVELFVRANLATATTPRSVATRVAAELNVGTMSLPFALESSAAEWILRLDGAGVRLPGFADLAQLFGGASALESSLPGLDSFGPLSLDSLELRVNANTRAISALSFAVAARQSWSLPGMSSLALRDAIVALTLQNPLSSTRTITGGVSAVVNIGDVSATLGCVLPGQFTLHLAALNLGALLQTLGAGAGLEGFGLPASFFNRTIGPLDLKIDPKTQHASIRGAAPGFEAFELHIKKDARGQMGAALALKPAGGVNLQTVMGVPGLENFALAKLLFVLSSLHDKQLRFESPAFAAISSITRGFGFQTEIDVATLGVGQIPGLPTNPLTMQGRFGRSLSDLTLAAAMAVPGGSIVLDAESGLALTSPELRISPASRQISVAGGLKVVLDGKQLDFTGAFGMKDAKPSLSATMEGEWREPFGLSGVVARDLALQLDLPDLPSLSGTLQVGRTIGAMTIKPHPSAPVLYMEIQNLDLHDFITSVCDPMLANVPADYRQTIADVRIDQAKLYVAPRDTDVGDVHCKAGVSVAGRMSIWGIDVDAYVKTAGSGPLKSLHADGTVSLPDLGGLLQIGGSLDANKTPQGKPKFLLKLEPTAVPVVQIDAAVKVLGASASSVNIQLNDAGFKLSLSGPLLGGNITGRLDISGGRFGNHTEYSVDAELDAAYLTTLLEVSRKVGEGITQASGELERAKGMLKQIEDKGVALATEAEQKRAAIQAERDHDTARLKQAEIDVQGQRAKADALLRELNAARATVEAERAEVTRRITAAQNDVNGARSTVNSLNHEINETDKWFHDLPKVDVPWKESQAREGVWFGLKMAGLYTARDTANAALTIADRVLEAVKLTQQTFSVDLDPRVVGILTAHATAQATLSATEETIAALRRGLNMIPIDADFRLVALRSLQEAQTVQLVAARAAVDLAQGMLSGIATLSSAFAPSITIKRAYFSGGLSQVSDGHVRLGLEIGTNQGDRAFTIGFNLNDALACVPELINRLLGTNLAAAVGAVKQSTDTAQKTIKSTETEALPPNAIVNLKCVSTGQLVHVLGSNLLRFGDLVALRMMTPPRFVPPPPGTFGLGTFVGGIYYVAAEENAEMNANRTGVGPWETWRIRNPNDLSSTDVVRYGEPICLYSHHGLYARAEENAQRPLASSTTPGPKERWIIRNATNPNQIGDVDTSQGIALMTWQGTYLGAWNGGGSFVYCNNSGIGAQETWSLQVYADSTAYANKLVAGGANASAPDYQFAVYSDGEWLGFRSVKTGNYLTVASDGTVNVTTSSSSFEARPEQRFRAEGAALYNQARGRFLTISAGAPHVISCNELVRSEPRNAFEIVQAPTSSGQGVLISSPSSSITTESGGSSGSMALSTFIAPTTPVERTGDDQTTAAAQQSALSQSTSAANASSAVGSAVDQAAQLRTSGASTVEPVRLALAKAEEDRRARRQRAIEKAARAPRDAMAGFRDGALRFDGRSYLEAPARRAVLREQPSTAVAPQDLPADTIVNVRYRATNQLLRVVGKNPLRYGDSISLRAAGGQYLVAQSSGGLTANQTAIGEWEIWKLVHPDDAGSTDFVRYGDPIALRSHHGRYLFCDNNKAANAARTSLGAWSRWSLILPSNSASRDEVDTSQPLALRSAQDTYLGVVNGGGGGTYANTSMLGGHETWTLVAPSWTAFDNRVVRRGNDGGDSACQFRIKRHAEWLGFQSVKSGRYLSVDEQRTLRAGSPSFDGADFRSEHFRIDGNALYNQAQSRYLRLVDSAAGTPQIVDGSGEQSSAASCGFEIVKANDDSLLTSAARVETRPIIELGSQFTIDAWICPERLGQSFILSKWENNEESEVMLGLTADGRLRMGWHVAGINNWAAPGWSFCQSSEAVKLNAWSHVAGVRDGDKISLYIDGRLVGGAQGLGTAPLRAGTATWRIGAMMAPGDVQGFEGLIDSLRIWNKAHSPASLRAQRYLVSRGNESDLLACWNLDEESGDTAFDAGPRELHARIIGRVLRASPGAPEGPPLPDGHLTLQGGAHAMIGDVDLFAGSTELTIESWVRLDRVGEDVAAILSKWTQDINAELIFGITASRALHFGWHTQDGTAFDTASWDDVTTSANIVPLGRWCHVAVVRDKSAIRFYRDGKEISASNAADDRPLRRGTASLCIGSQGGQARRLEGSLAELRVFRRALSTEETEKPPAKPVGSFASRSRSKRLVSRCHLPASTQIGNRGHLVPAHSTRALLLAKLTARISRATPD